MAFLNNIRLEKKLIITYIIIVIVPIFIIGYFLTNKLNKTSFSNITQLTNIAMNQLEENIIDKIYSYKEILDVLIEDPVFRKYISTYYSDDYEALNDYQYRINPLINRLSGTSGNTIIKVYTNNSTIGFSSVTNNPMEELINSGWFDNLTTPYYLNRINLIELIKSDSKYLGLYRVIRNDYDLNKIDAVVVVFFSKELLYTLISEEKLGGKIIFLSDNSGSVITSTEKSSIGGNINVLTFNKNDAFNNIKNDSIITYLGKKYHFLKSDIVNESLSINRWSIIYMTPADGILSNIINIWINTLFLCLVCLLSTMIIILFVSKSITQRILNLIQTIKMVWGGDFNVSVKISGNDEVGMLEMNFNDMVKKIDVLIHEVYEANLRIKDVEINNQKIQMEKKIAELVALQGQINPHYLFNTMETVRMNLVLNGDRETANIIKVFADSFRICVDDSQDMHLLSEEVKFIENYFLIQKYRYKDKINFNIDIQKQLIGYIIPKLIIQPLVENAVYHGIEIKRGCGNVNIMIYRHEDEIIIKVCDDGVGIDKDDLAKIKRDIFSLESNKFMGKTRLALKNVHNRLQLIYGDRYDLKISSEKGKGTAVEINMPLLK